MIITVSGLAGTGTTSVCRILEEDLGFEYIYAGEIFRKEAEKYGKSIEEFCQHLEENPELDKAIDKKLIEFAKEHPNTILEGRLAGWMVEKEGLKAIKILLTADIKVSAERVASRDLYLHSKEEAKKRVEERDFRDKERYKKLYNIDISDKSIYNKVIRTDNKTIKEEVEEIKSML